jgi:redox-sensitive bicupin YhaK (pirin superfamily)
MITLRPAGERGVTALGWLDSRHTFSFGDYFDPRHVQYRSLRVLNDDRVAADGGFPRHPHRDMEIITWVLSGALEHRDSLGNGSVIGPGDLQCMSAGTGIVHSEYNPSPTEPVHFLQVWLTPARRGLTPGYEQRHFAEGERRGRLRLVASPDGRDGSVTIHQQADVYAALLGAGDAVTHRPAAGRGAWLHVARGAASLNGKALREGDAAAVEGEGLTVAADGAAEVLLFDLA